MKLRFLACLAIFFTLTSCGDEGEIPKGIFPVDRMKVIMFDVISAQEMAQVVANKDTTAARQKTFELYQQVFDIYKINREDFFKSFTYYEGHPDQLKVLTDSLYAYGTRKRQELYMKMK